MARNRLSEMRVPARLSNVLRFTTGVLLRIAKRLDEEDYRVVLFLRKERPPIVLEDD